MAEKPTTNPADEVFGTLYALDVTDKIKEKNGLQYLPWSAAWAEVKKLYPGATFTIYKQKMDELGNTRFWHDDGHTGWVEVGVTIHGLEVIENLAIMDFKNKSIPADQITSVDANKSMKRCLVKALAEHGLALHVYLGEDLPEDVRQTNDLQTELLALINKKASLSDKAKEKVAELCKAAEAEANPHFEANEITGDPRNIDSIEILEKLKRQLLTVRK